MQMKADDRLQERLGGNVDRHARGHVRQEFGDQRFGHQERFGGEAARRAAASPAGCLRPRTSVRRGACGREDCDTRPRGGRPASRCGMRVMQRHRKTDSIRHIQSSNETIAQTVPPIVLLAPFAYSSPPPIPSSSSFLRSVVRCRPRRREAARHCPPACCKAAFSSGGSTRRSNRS